MSSQQQSVEDVFGAALERPADERAAFLDQACSADPALRRLVNDLLLADERAGSFLEEPLLLQLADLPEGLASPTSDTYLTHAGDPAFSLPTPDLTRFAAGQRIAGRFTVVRFLARGGMGEVYEVDDQLLQGARVALKAILPHIAADAGASRRFEQEVLLARKVVHPNLCPIYDIARCHDAEPPFLFLTMKLLSGETLAARLRAPDPIPYEDALALARQITCGLAAIHDAGVVHGDIKPNNIMLEGSGRALSLSIMDFGLARLHTAEHTVLTRTLIAGTPGYLAPEILRGERPSQATDLFALGVLLHRVLVGRAPETVFSSLAVHPSPDLDGPGVPAFLAEAVRGLLSELPAPRTLAFAGLLARYDPAHPQIGLVPDVAGRPDQQSERRKHRPYTGPDRRVSHRSRPEAPGVHLLKPPRPAARGLESLPPAPAHPPGRDLIRSDRPGFAPAIAASASLRPHLTRRTFALGSAAAVCAAAAGTLAWRPTLLDDLLHPLPRKRFVALLGWPAPEPQLKPMLMSLIDSIGSELARAEAFDRDLYIIPHTSSADITTPDQLNDIRESSGANLVLAASATPAGNDVHLNLQLLDPNHPQPLRTKHISVPADQQASLLHRSLTAATDLLDIHHFTPDLRRLSALTDNPQALAAFQAAETLRNQPNNAGLDAALEKYKEAVELDAKFALAYAKLALAYFSLYILHRDAAALLLTRANCETALSIAPLLVEAHLARAEVLDGSGQRALALGETGRALAIDPTSPGALALHALTLTRCNRWEEAEQTMHRLLQARPNHWRGHVQLGYLYSLTGRYADAVMEFRSASLALPRDARSLYEVAAVYLQQGKVDQARQYARRSLSLATSPAAAAILAEVLRSEANYADALNYARQATTLDPDDPGNWLELADCCGGVPSQKDVAAKAYLKAGTLQQEALTVDPADGPGWMILALTRAKAGDIPGTQDLLRKADSTYSDDLESQLFKVRTLALIGRRDEALALASQCLARGATIFQFDTMPDLQELRRDDRYRRLRHSFPLPA